jgi:Fur family transcriptional regulator, iron response regulator
MSTESIPVSGTLARARAILEHHGVRPTSQRLRIAEILLAQPRHLTAEQILETLRKSQGRVSKATVYNTLKLFVDHGLLRQIHADPERCVYDSLTTPHHHFQDLDTGEMFDIQPDELSFAKLPVLPPDTELAHVSVVIGIRRTA